MTREDKVYYILRMAVAMCFIGHGAFGIITKPIWCNYFAVFGVGKELAFTLMPLLGGIDILLGIVMLVYPVRAVAAWLVVWGLVTASLRPLSGEPFAELIERAGNFGAPLALLLLVARPGDGGWRYWFGRMAQPGDRDAAVQQQVTWCLRIVVFLLLLGHGWLNLIEKKSLLAQYSALGSGNPVLVAHMAGLLEILAALTLLVRPARPLILAFFVWKMASELFYPHWELFEWVERGGSYGSLLALWLLTGKKVMAEDRLAINVIN